MMEQYVKSTENLPLSYNNKGFSLVEVLVALLLVMVVMMALLEAVVLHVQTNMRNILRDEGVRITQDVLHELRSRDFSRVTAGTETINIQKAIRSTQWTYTVTVQITDWPAPPNPPKTKSLEATTRWQYLGQTYSHSANTMMSR